MKSKLIFMMWMGLLAQVVSGQSLQFGAPHAKAERGQPIDDIALVVNDQAITRSTLQTELAAERALLPPNLPISGAELNKQLLERVIINHLLQQIQKRANIEVSEAEIQAAIQRIAHQNKLSEAALYRQVKKSTGLNMRRYQEQIKRDILQEKLKQVLLSGSIHITEGQINDQIAQIARQQGGTLHVQDMLLPIPEGTPFERAEKVDKIIANVANELRRQKQNLQIVASQIPEARFQDFGEVNLSQISPQFSRVLANTAVGEMAEAPVIDHNGMHFLKVVNKKGSGEYQVEEAKVAQIFLRIGQGRNEQLQRQRAEEIWQQLSKGANFAQLARQYSEDAKSAAQGGELGWVSAEEVSPEFAKVIHSQPIGQFSRPIKTPDGYHIVFIEDRKSSDKSEDVLRRNIRNALFARAVAEAWEQELRTLREEAYIDIR